MIRLIFAVSLTLFAAAPVFSQDEAPPAAKANADERRRRWNDYGGLLTILHNRRLEFVASVDPLIASPEDSLLVILGEVDDSIGANMLWRRFLRRGGRVLIASDRPTLNKTLSGMKVSIWDRGRIQVKAESPALRRYRAFPDCPIIATKGPHVPDPAHPLLQKVSAIAFNRPACLDSGRFKTVLRFPEGATLSEAPVIAAGEVRGRRGAIPGRVVVVADHSPFINAMLIVEGNRRFLDNSLNWLAERGPLTRVLVFADGRIQKPLIGAREAQDLGIDGLTGMLNYFLVKIGNSSAYGPHLSDWGRWGFRELLMTMDPVLVLAIVLLGIVLIALLRRPTTPDAMVIREAGELPHFAWLRGQTEPGAVSSAGALALVHSISRVIAERLELPKVSSFDALSRAYRARVNDGEACRQLDELGIRMQSWSHRDEAVSLQSLEELRVITHAVLSPLATEGEIS